MTEVFLLPGKSGRPRWADICRYASSEEIERREDKITSMRSALISGRTGTWTGGIAFTTHGNNRRRDVEQVEFFAEAGIRSAIVAVRFPISQHLAEDDGVGEVAVGEVHIGQEFFVERGEQRLDV